MVRIGKQYCPAFITGNIGVEPRRPFSSPHILFHLVVLFNLLGMIGGAYAQIQNDSYPSLEGLRLLATSPGRHAVMAIPGKPLATFTLDQEIDDLQAILVDILADRIVLEQTANEAHSAPRRVWVYRTEAVHPASPVVSFERVAPTQPARRRPLHRTLHSADPVDQPE